MAQCSLRVESLEGLEVSEEYLRGYLEAFGVNTHSIAADRLYCKTVTCDRCYDILDRLTSMNADHQKPGHKGKKLKFQLVAGNGPFSEESRAKMGSQPSNELHVSGFTAATVSESDLIALFGLYGKVRMLEMKDASAYVEYSDFESAASAMSALSDGFFRGCFLSVEYAQELRGGEMSPQPGSAIPRKPGSVAPPDHDISRDSSWNSKTWDNCLDADTGRAEETAAILQMSNTTEAEEFLTRSRLTSPLIRSDAAQKRGPLTASYTSTAPDALAEVLLSGPNDNRVSSGTGSVITLDSTSASSIQSSRYTHGSEGLAHVAPGGAVHNSPPPHVNINMNTDSWINAANMGQTDVAIEGSGGSVVWMQPPPGDNYSATAKDSTFSSDPRGNFLNSLREQNGWSGLGDIGIAHGGDGSSEKLKYSAADPLFESFLSFNPSLLASPPPNTNGLSRQKGKRNNLGFDPVVIDLASENDSDPKCAITGTSIASSQYDKYLDLVNSYFSETTIAETTGQVVKQTADGRFVVRDNSAKSVAFSDLSDDLVGVPLNHDTPEFVPKSHQSDTGSGSVASGGGGNGAGGLLKKVEKSTDPEDMSEAGECDDQSNDNSTKGEYSIHSGQFEADIRNIFVGNIGRLLSDGVQQLISYFKALGIVVLKVDIKISFAFLEVRNTPGLEEQVKAIALGSGGKPPPFGKDERILRIEFVEQASAGKRNIRLRRENLQTPTQSLFIVGFDHRRTPTSLLTSVFAPFGPLEYVELKNNYAFVNFVNLADATVAQKKTHGMTIHDRTLSVEFSSRNTTDRSGNLTPDNGGPSDSTNPVSASSGNGGKFFDGGGPRRLPTPRDQAPRGGRGYGDDRGFPPQQQRGRGMGGGGYQRYEHSNSPSPLHRIVHRQGPDMGPGPGPMFPQQFPPPQFDLAPYYSNGMPPYHAAGPPPPNMQPNFPQRYNDPNYYGAGAPPLPPHGGNGPPVGMPTWQQEQNPHSRPAPLVHSRGRSGGGFERSDWRQYGAPAYSVDGRGSPLDNNQRGVYPPPDNMSPARPQQFRS